MVTHIQSEKVNWQVCCVHSRHRRNIGGLFRVFGNRESYLFSPILFVISRKKAFLLNPTKVDLTMFRPEHFCIVMLRIKNSQHHI